MKEIFFKVNGMMCEGCENRVKNAVKTLNGVEDVSANHNTGVVCVKTSMDINPKDIEEIIDDIGYEVEEN